MKYYSIDFVKRTQVLLKDLSSKAKELELDVTFLINTLLGLIVLCSEEGAEIFNEKIDEEFILKVIPENIEIFESTKINFTGNFDDKINIELSKKEFLLNQTKHWYIKKLRNGIAHHNIEIHSEPSERNGAWSHVTIFNTKDSKKGKIDFKIKLSINELYNLAMEISNIYLKKKQK